MCRARPGRDVRAGQASGRSHQRLRDSIFDIFKAAGFKLAGDDRFRNIEAALYGLMRESNPTEYQLDTGEGFGYAMDTDAKSRVIRQAERDRDALKALVRQAERDRDALKALGV